MLSRLEVVVAARGFSLAVCNDYAAATLNEAPFLDVAGLWRPGRGNQPPSFTMLKKGAGTRRGGLPWTPGRGAAPTGEASLV